jgi:hypothetical protein
MSWRTSNCGGLLVGFYTARVGTSRALLEGSAAGWASGPFLNNMHWWPGIVGSRRGLYTAWVGHRGALLGGLLLAWPEDHPSSIVAGGPGIEGPRRGFTHVAKGREGTCDALVVADWNDVPGEQSTPTQQSTSGGFFVLLRPPFSRGWVVL